MQEPSQESVGLGHIYAAALYAVAKRDGVLPDVTDDIRSLKELIDAQPQLEQFFHAVSISEDQRKTTIEKIFAGRVNPITLQLLLVLVQRDRLMHIAGVIVAFEEILDEKSGQLKATVTGAQALDPAAVGRIEAALSSAFGRTVIVQAGVDPALLGGLKIRVGDTVFDGSVDSQLSRFKERLKTGGAVALQSRMDKVVVEAGV